MAKYSIEKTTLTNIANPLRSLRGLTGGMTPEEMANNANAVQTNVTNSLSEVAAKGVSVPSTANSDDLPGLIRSISQGVELPELDNPGSEADLMAGKQLIDADGNPVTGAFTVEEEVNTLAEKLAELNTILESKVAGGGIKTCDVKIVFDFVVSSDDFQTDIDAYYPQLDNGAISPYNYTNIMTIAGYKPNDLNISSCPVGQTVALEIYGGITSWAVYTVDASEAIEVEYCGSSMEIMFLWIPPTAQGEFVITISEQSEE